MNRDENEQLRNPNATASPRKRWLALVVLLIVAAGALGIGQTPALIELPGGAQHVR